MFEEIKPLQQKQLEILKELKRVCELNGLTYFIAFGTLLGAVRHKGFIPWDDDVDVCMFYKDYQRLEEACNKDLSKEYFLQSVDSDPQSHLTFKRLRASNTTLITSDFTDCDMNHGIAIDIYPLYNLSDDKSKRKKQVRASLMYMLFKTGNPPQNHGKLVKTAASMLLALNKGKRRVKKIDKYARIMTEYNDRPTEYIGMLFGNPETCRKEYPSDFFADTVELQFEDAVFSAPIDYDGFLRFEYGDYMKLPPIEEQGIKLEKIIKLDVDTPYTEYKGVFYCCDKKRK